MTTIASCAAAPPMPPVAAPTPTHATGAPVHPGSDAGTPATTGGGGPADAARLVPVLEQLVATLGALTTTIGTTMAGAQAQAGAAAAPVPGPDPGSALGGGGVPGCCCATAVAGAAGVAAPAAQVGAAAAPAPVVAGPDPSPTSASAAPAPARALDAPDLTVKGVRMGPDQRRNLQAVLEVGVGMGASTKVLEAAVSTVIQESVARNDSSVDGRDRDSLGLFQQRPSQGWGTREQIADPRYAARKFFERAIEKDRAQPGLSNTRLAQAVQRSAHPDAYAKWDAEARRIVADFNG